MATWIQKMRKGKIERDEWYGEIYICSTCGGVMMSRTNYCSRCGEKMDNPDTLDCQVNNPNPC